MGERAYNYQYETSPRKLKPEYERKKVKKQKPIDKSKIKRQVDKKTQKKIEIKSKVSLFIKSLAIFAIIFFIMLRNSQINASFSEIQSLKAEITSIQKENDQLEVRIQNSLNLNNIEQAAKELLGMQKLTSKQTVYINLSKEDYVEPKTEKVIIEDESSVWEKIVEKIKNIF